MNAPLKVLWLLWGYYLYIFLSKMLVMLYPPNPKYQLWFKVSLINIYLLEILNILFSNSSADFRKIQSMHNYTRPQNESVHTYKIKLLAQPWIISLLYCLVHTCREKIGEKIAVQIVYVINRLPNTADGQHYARDRCFIRTTQHCTVNYPNLWAFFNTNSIPSKK